MPVPSIAPPLTGRALTSQHWDNLTFLHWPVAPADIAPFFPPGTRPDLLDGTTYVGLVPFQMRGAGPGVPVPYFGRFCETNVRLYSVDDEDRHGILFLTLEASRLATVALARVGLGLPYTWSSMSVHRSANTISYRSRRRWPERARGARTAVTVRLHPGGGTVPVGTDPIDTDPIDTEASEPTEPIALAPNELDPVEPWLTARWGLHTRVAGRTLWIPNHHGPWPLYRADLEHLDDDLVTACAVPVERDRLLRPLWSPGVRTTFGWPITV